jgi:hypothetical protein
VYLPRLVHIGFITGQLPLLLHLTYLYHDGILTHLIFEPHPMVPPLPEPFCEDKWQKQGISTFLRWVALQLYPWHLDDKQLLSALEKIMHALYGATINLLERQSLSDLLVKHVGALILSLTRPLTHTLQARNHIHQYCESFGVAALNALNAHFEMNRKWFKGSLDLRVCFAQDQMISRRFLYKKPYRQDPLVSPFVLNAAISAHPFTRNGGAHSEVP